MELQRVDCRSSCMINVVHGDRGVQPLLKRCPQLCPVRVSRNAGADLHHKNDSQECRILKKKEIIINKLINRIYDTSDFASFEPILCENILLKIVENDIFTTFLILPFVMTQRSCIPKLFKKVVSYYRAYRQTDRQKQFYHKVAFAT
jgi:hypothetical protein